MGSVRDFGGERLELESHLARAPPGIADATVWRGSRRGPFLACSGFPKCRNAKPLPDELREEPKETAEICEKCGEPMVIKTSRWGKEFLACSGYPKCRNARDVVPKEEDSEDQLGAAEPAAGEAEPAP